ncbi:RadC family protein [Chloroflexota bacterium]
MATFDPPNLEVQLPLIDMTGGVSPLTKHHHHKVEKTLSKLRQLHDQLNSELYANPTQRPVINSPADAADLFRPFMGPLDHEEMWVAVLDTRNRVRCLVSLYKGTVNCSQVRVAEVFRQAIIENAPSIILSHNHPSMDVSPSPDDVAITRTVVQAGKLLEIEVLDHIIVSSNSFISMKERGLGYP